MKLLEYKDKQEELLGLMEKFADESKKDKSRSIKKDERDIKEGDDNTIWKVIKDARKEENKSQKLTLLLFLHI